MALSGGGSRAANFSAAVMWELDQLGILERVQYVSSVSGGSLPAAYYALFKREPQRWNEPTLKRLMAKNFECLGWRALLNPLRWPLFLGTSYDRTSVLAEVFDAHLFQHRTFSQLPQDAPVLLLNATDYVRGERFVFSNESFETLGSDLGQLPIAVGVMASAAYPGLLRAVTLKDFHPRGAPRPRDLLQPEGLARLADTPYLHLIDGGVIDNLGLDSLARAYIKQLERNPARFTNGCLLILVDAQTPSEEARLGWQPDTRGPIDLLFDTNALRAVGILMTSKREQQLAALGFDSLHQWAAIREAKAHGTGWTERRLSPQEIQQPLSFLEEGRLGRGVFVPADDSMAQAPEPSPAPPCRVWHIALQDLAINAPYPELYEAAYLRQYAAQFGESYPEFRAVLTEIPTRFFLHPTHRERLYAAAQLLVHEPASQRTICGWLYDLTGQTCRSAHGDSAATGQSEAADIAPPR